MTQQHKISSIASRALAALVVLALVGCGSAGGGGSPSSPSTPSGAATTATLSLTIPPATAQSLFGKSNFVSPNSAAIQINIDNVNGSTTVPAGIPASDTINLTTGSGGTCAAPTATGEACTVSFLTPAGTIVFTFTLLDKTGQPLATAKKQFTIVKGQANSLQVVLGGIVASVTILVPSITSGIPSTGTLIVNAFDASGALIDASAPYAVPIVLTDTDGTTDTHLEVRGSIGPTAQVNSAGDVVTFIYNGNPSVPPFFINATVGGTAVGAAGPIVPTTQAISFSNTFIDAGAKGDPNFGQPTLFFSTVPQTETTTATETGYSGSFTAVLDPVTCAGPVGTLSGSPGTTFTVASANPGVCKVVVSDTIGHASVFWISVTTGVVGVNSRVRKVLK